MTYLFTSLVIFSANYRFLIALGTLYECLLSNCKIFFTGDCCADCCPSSCNNATICAFCPPSSSCNRAFHVNVEFFHLGRVDIPEVVTERYLTRTLLKVSIKTQLMSKHTYMYVHCISCKEKNWSNVNPVIASAASSKN